MNNKNIAAISVQEIDNTIGALKGLRQRMPFLVTLSPLERRHGATVGPSRVRETQASLRAVREHPGLVPSTFDLARFEHAAQATIRLHQCLTLLKGLTSDVQDTLLSVGADAITGAQQVRALVKMAAKTTPGLGQLLQDLESRAPRPGPVADDDAPPAASKPAPAPEPERAAAPAPQTPSETPVETKAA